MILLILNAIATIAQLTTVICWFAKGNSQIARRLFFELRPFWLWLIPAVYAHSMFGPHYGLSIMDYFAIGCDVLTWWFFHQIDDDDDRWKRRRRKVAEKVANIGGRLTVVPAGAR